MKTIQLRQLIDLVAGDVGDGESRIEKVFDWRFARDLAIVKWILGFAASLAVGMVIAFFRANANGQSQLTFGEVATAFGIALAVASYGIYRLWLLRRLHEQFTTALMLYGRFRLIGDFIHRYRRDS